MRGSRRILTVAALGLLFGARPVHAGDGFDSQAESYREAVSADGKKSMSLRAAARTNLAKSRDPRAIPLFIDDYRQKAWAAGPDRFLIASIAGRYCKGQPTLAPAYAAWREQCATTADAWLWYRALLVEAEFAPEIASSVVLDASREGALRAAALRVVEERLPKDAFDLVVALGKAVPNDRGGRGLLVEGMASLVATARKHIKEPSYRRALRSVLNSLDDPLNSIRIREFVGRRLAIVFGTDVLATNGSPPWQREFDASGVPAPVAPPSPIPPPADPAPPPVPKQPSEPLGPVFPKGFDPDDPDTPGSPRFPKGLEEPEDDPDDPERYAGPTVFFGISAVGTRAAYVIDGSGSMRTPLSRNELEDLRKRANTDTGGQKGKAVDPSADASEIDWRTVRTRFDAAREFLKASLRRQLREAGKDHERAKARGSVTGDGKPRPIVAPPPPRSFTIVMFSREARSLRSTPGMMPVTKANVDAAITELDAAGPDGLTNLHGGLRRGFSAGEKGAGSMDAYADFDTLHAGCDVLFLLSDGDPTADDWSIGKGAYLDADNIVEDVLRWNLFRRAEIHCVGVGEAPSDLLGRIASVGGGKVVVLGKRR